MTGRVGSSECTPCPANQYAELSGSLACKPCVGETYSLFGAGKCEEKVECGGEDFRPVVGECVAGKIADTELINSVLPKLFNLLSRVVNKE